MASVSADPRGNRVVQFTSPDRKRRTLRPGKAPMKTAEQVKRMIERLDAALRKELIGKNPFADQRAPVRGPADSGASA